MRVRAVGGRSHRTKNVLRSVESILGRYDCGLVAFYDGLKSCGGVLARSNYHVLPRVRSLSRSLSAVLASGLRASCSARYLGGH